MPNWVKNYIHVKCDKATFDKIKNYVASDELEFDFEKIIPMPSNVFRGNLGVEEQREYPGDLNWYDWSCNHWGTKWNAYEPSCFGTTFAFETAWSEPNPVIAKLAEKFPKAKFKHEYANEDIGYDCGVKVYENGKLKLYDDRKGDYKFACNIWDYDYEEWRRECL